MVSVIIPTYNRAAVLHESIRSVLDQTYSNLELLVIDDGSTDNTDNLIRSFSDKRLVYLKQLHQGACVARNLGIEKARGDYIAFNDSDDIWEKNKLQKQLDFLQKQQADLVYCGMNRIIGEETRYFPAEQRPQESVTIEKILSGNKISTQTILVKREVASEIRFDPSFRRFQDWDFALRVLEQGYKAAYLPEALVTTYLQQDSITFRVSPEESYLYFMKVHMKQYKRYPWQIGAVYELISFESRRNYRIKVYYLFQALKCRFRLKTLLKLFLAIINLY